MAEVQLKPSEQKAHSLSRKSMSFKTVYQNDGEIKTFRGRGKISLLLANMVPLKKPSEIQ